MKKIGMIGIGKMGKILSRSIAQHHPDIELSLLARRPEKIQDFAKDIHGQIIDPRDTIQMIQSVDLIIVCLKPHQFEPFFTNIKKEMSSIPPKIWISIAVGLPLNRLQSFTPQQHSWIRLMPNTPVEVDRGYIALCHSDSISKQDIDVVTSLFQTSAIIEIFEETYFDVVSAITGSGPAFMYQLMEAMADAAVKHGINRDKAYQMVGQLLVGSGQMLIESHKHPGQLKDDVTSPGGTTIAGVTNLEKNGLRWAMIDAIDETIKKASTTQ